MENQNPLQKAIALDKNYQSAAVRSIFLTSKGYPDTDASFKKNRNNFFNWLLEETSRDYREQLEIQRHLNEIKKDRLSAEEHFKEELKILGGGDQDLGRNFYEIYQYE